MVSLPIDSVKGSTQRVTAGRASQDLLLKISEAVGSNLHLSGVLDTILQASMEEISAQEGSVLLRDESRDCLELLAARGLSDDIVRRSHVPRRNSITAWVIENGQPLILNGKWRGRRFPASQLVTRSITSAMCLPLRARGRVIGTLNLNRTKADLGVFKRSTLNLMTLVSGHAAESIEIARLHEAVIRAERLAAIGQTVSGVAHCIKNLLTSLQGGVQICRDAARRESVEDFDRGSRLLERGVARVSGLALDMLEYAKEREPRRQQIDLHNVIAELIAHKASEAQARCVVLEHAIEPGARFATGDSDQLFRCVLNLLDNAIDVTGKGGRVQIGVQLEERDEILRHLQRSAPAALVIRVSDNGHGVDPDLREQIFEPFFTTKGSRGTGLGLAVVQKIMREHGGEVRLESSSDHGATFALYLPVELP